MTHSPVSSGNLLFLFKNVPTELSITKDSIKKEEKNGFHLLNHVEIVGDDENSDEAWEALFQRMVTKLLNKKIPPHKLISVSFFEDSHKPKDIYEEETPPRKLNASVLHRSDGEDLVPVNDHIYSLKVFKGNNWHEEVSKAKDYMNERGGEQGHVVSVVNSMPTDNLIVVVISWSRAVQAIY